MSRVRRAVGAGVVLVAVSGVPASADPGGVDLVPVASFASSSGAMSAGTEIVAFDPASDRAFTTNGIANRVDVTDLSNPSAPVARTPIELSSFGTDVQSVAVRNGVVAAAVKGTSTQANGSVVFFTTDGTFLRSATVGALPDNVVFTPDGTRVLTANEGEPNGVGTGNADPQGSVSVVTVVTGAVATASFAPFDSQRATLVADGVRLNFPGASVSQDLEPEFVTLSADGATAYVTLQENNAIATINVATATVTRIDGLGTKDHRTPGNGLDPSDRDSSSNGPAIGIANRPLDGMYMPDGIARLTTSAGTFLLTANEGDEREYPAISGSGASDFSDTARVSTRDLDDATFPDEATLKGNGPNGIGRLAVSTTDGTGGDADHERLHSFGARSFSVFTTDGTLVYDSGDDLEQLTAARIPTFFNSQGVATPTADGLDTRSDNKGPEPESVVVGRVGARDLAFVALERVGGVATFDVSQPVAPTLADYVNPAAEGSAIGRTDRSPEGLAFVAAADSPNGVALLLVANEVSGTTTVFEVRPAAGVDPIIPESPFAVLLPLAAIALGGGLILRRRLATV